MPYIVSKLAADVCYNDYTPQNGVNVRTGGVLIKGGAGVANRKHALADGVLTPDGVLTAVNDDQLSFLMKDEVFKTHLKNGHVKVLEKKPEPNKVAKDMESDGSAPLTEADMKPGGRSVAPADMTVNTGSPIK